MLSNTLLHYVNNKILSLTSNIRYTVASDAPSSVKDLVNTTSLVIWSGESNNTIYQDCHVNYAFRALHDAKHIETGLDFSIDSEIEIGRRQASKYDGIFADLIYIEIAEQALYYKQHRTFVSNPNEFTMELLQWVT